MRDSRFAALVGKLSATTYFSFWTSVGIYAGVDSQVLAALQGIRGARKHIEKKDT